LLITLYAKALGFRSKKSILHDERADEIVQKIAYDFTKLKSFGNQAVIPLRAKQYDEWVRTFLRTHQNAVVLNLRCGLDTRSSRIKPSGSVSWYDVDFPDVIAVRKKFYEDQKNYSMLGYSLTPTDWLSLLPKGRPTLIIAEGVLEYMAAEDVKALLGSLVDHFRHGQIAFDVMTPYAIQSARSDLKDKTGAVHQWAVENVNEVDALAPQLSSRMVLPLFSSEYARLLPLRYRLLCALLAVMPRFKIMLRLLRYDF
jgi:O-methyltransferase involved in polyketide biosynthesis